MATDTKKPAAAAAASDTKAPAVKASLLGSTVLGFSLPQIVGLVGTVASAVVPGAAVAGLSIEAITKLGMAVAAEIPEALAAFDEIKTVANSGLPPTDEQWAAWNAAADASHAAAQAAADKVINGSGA